MVRIPVYIGQIIDATVILLYFLLLFAFGPKYRQRSNYLVAALSTLIISIIDTKFNPASDFLIPLVIFFLMRPVKTNYFDKLRLYCFSYLIVAFSASIIGYQLTRMIDIRHLTDHTVAYNFIILHTFLLYFLTAVIAIICILIYDRLKKNINFHDPVILRLIVVGAVILAIGIGLILIFSRLLAQQLTLALLNIGVMTIMLVLTLISLFFYLTSYQKQLQAEKAQQKSQNDALYLHELQLNYDNLRRFKHDYKNLLLSLSVLLAEKNITAAQQAVTKFLELSDQESGETLLHTKSLTRIPDDLIRSLIIAKTSFANRQGLKVDLEIDDHLTSLGDQQADILRILGILFDNAIDGAHSSEKQQIRVAILQLNGTQEFIIQNTIKSATIDLEQIEKFGYSTKAAHAGLGLATVHQICDANDHLLQFTAVDHLFTCTLIV